ncbi:MAG: metallophosphoesterase [Bdellovibrionales bacterium]|nr:metallophosphoesterase [Bdellovibrionales bacterium]
MAKKAKLIVSDLHLGIGRILKDGTQNTFEEFYFDEKFVEFLHFYSSKDYSDHDVELILNGDILNLLQVDYRGHYLTVITEDVSLEKTKRIVEGHPKFFKAIKKFVSKEGNSVTWVVGNHDQDLLWPAVRAYLNEVLGTDIRFKNIVYFFDGVHVEHGHMHEAANRLDSKKFFLRKDVAEPILNLPFGSLFFVDLVLKIKQEYPHVDKIRPFERMMRWALFNEFKMTLKWVLNLGLFFLRILFGQDNKRNYGIKNLTKIVLESAVFPDLSSAAKKILEDDRTHTVVFGHTHVYQYRQYQDGKEYFNSGTWTDLTSLDISTLGKVTKMTYVLIEYPDDKDRPFGRLKEWHGYHKVEADVAIS